MDRLIRRFDVVKDDDLCIAEARGVAYQRDMSKDPVKYNDAYFEKVSAYSGNDIARRVTDGRIELLKRHIGEGAKVLDYGAGSLEFLHAATAAGFAVRGFDVMDKTMGQLVVASLFSKNASDFDALCLWDTLEHMAEPEKAFADLPKGGFMFVSIPTFESLDQIRTSRHYRPGEHLYYFTRQGFIDYLRMHGFACVEVSDQETDAGRESITEFVAVKNMPDQNDYIQQYDQMHAEKFYGSSAVELHFPIVSRTVKELNPNSILDFGCGRSEMACFFWKDGERHIQRYDPAIRAYRQLSLRKFDLILCLDVMEHIPISNVDATLNQMRTRSDAVIFTISTKLARAKLPNGSNAHCTLLTKREWSRWIKSYFGEVKQIASEWEHELILLAGPRYG